MAQYIVAHEQPLAKVLSEDYAFRIPEYQRPYAWTTEQAGDLIDDLTSFMEANPGRIEDMPTYFLGSIVLIKGDTPDSDVVDGQQRLTTLTLLLSAIRATASGQQVVDLTSFIYEKGNTIKGTTDRFRLNIRERDSEFFRKYVQKEGGFIELIASKADLKDSQLRLRENAILFSKRLDEMPPETRLALASFIVTRSFLVVVATPDQNSAYRIFSVLNSRGLDLSPTDILKAQIVGAIPEGRRDEYTKKWEDIEEELGRDDFGNLFGHIRSIYRKTKAKETLLKEFEAYVPELKQPLKFVDNLLMPAAEAYSEIVASAYTSTSNAELVNEHLRWLNRLEFTDWMPPAIAFSMRFRNDPQRMVDFFRDLERLSFFMLVTKVGINDRIDRFGRVTRSIEETGSGGAALDLSTYEQQEFFEALDGAVYESLSAKARSLLLLRLDSLLSGGGATYDYPVVTVEHVLPQTPSGGSQWLEWFPEQAQRRALTHRLGNLALLTRKKNSSASNYELERKQTAYFTKGGISPFVLTTEVIGRKTWSPEIILERQKRHLEKLESHWALKDRKSLEVILG